MRSKKNNLITWAGGWGTFHAYRRAECRGRHASANKTFGCISYRSRGWKEDSSTLISLLHYITSIKVGNLYVSLTNAIETRLFHCSTGINCKDKAMENYVDFFEQYS